MAADHDSQFQLLDSDAGTDDRPAPDDGATCLDARQARWQAALQARRQRLRTEFDRVEQALLFDADQAAPSPDAGPGPDTEPDDGLTAPPESAAEPRPFRLTPLSAEPGQWRHLNRLHQFKGARAYEEPAKAMERAATAQSANRDRLLGWAEHPDEGVPVAMLLNPKRIWRSGGLDLVLRLYCRAFHGADAEGMVWTPLLDALAHAGAWPNQDELHLLRHTTIYRRDMEPPEVTDSPYQRLHRLDGWLARATDPAESAALLRFRFHLAHERAAVLAPVVDDGFVDAVLERPLAVRHLASNSNAGDKNRVRAMEWAVDILERRCKETLSLFYDRSPRGKDIAFGTLAYDTLRSASSSFAGTPVPRPLVERLITLANSRGYRGGGHWDSSYAMFSLTAAELGVTPEDLHAVSETAVWSKFATRALAETGRLLPATWVEIIDHQYHHLRRKRVRQALLVDAAALRDPEVRARLRGRNIKGLRSALLRSAEGADFRRRFRGLCRKRLPLAARVLRERHDEVIGSLKPEDLIPLLQAPDSEIRLYALTALSEVDARRARWVQERQAAGKPIARRR